jgi:hypothetical protein
MRALIAFAAMIVIAHTAAASTPPRFAVQNGTLTLSELPAETPEPATPGITPRPAGAVVFSATCTRDPSIREPDAWCGYTSSKNLIAFRLDEKNGGGWIFQAIGDANDAKAEWHVVNDRAKVRAFTPSGVVVNSAQLFPFTEIAE